MISKYPHGRTDARHSGLANALSRSLLLGSVAAACLLAPNANAQCAPDPATDGDDIVCSGTDTDGIVAVGKNITLTVETDATVLVNGATAITMNGGHYDFINRGVIGGQFLGPSDTVVGLYGLEDADQSTGVNEGEIYAIDGPAYALELTRGVARFENREGATIRSTTGRAVHLGLGFGGVFENSGLVTSESARAIQISTGGSSFPVEIINNATGQIISPTEYAIDHFADSTVNITNSGLIRGALGVSIYDGAITNLEGGLIEGTTGVALRSRAVFSGQQVTITNHGTLRGWGDAVSGNAYKLINTGVIEGGVGEASFYTTQDVVNTGSILGSLRLGGHHDALENSGLVAGYVDLGDGNDVFRDFGGSIGVYVNLGQGDNFWLVRTGVDQGHLGTYGMVTGIGLDSFGYSVDGIETVTLSTLAGFEGLAVEALNEDSEATIAQGSFDRTLSLLGSGQITNLADFTNLSGDAVRLYSDGIDGVNVITTPFGSGVTFINEGNLSATGGLAIRSVADFLSGDGAETITNRGNVYGDISLGDGSDTLINELLIVGNISTGDDSSSSDNDFIRNSGEIQGAISTGNGNDRIINAGRILGVIDLGVGDDDYLIDLDATQTVIGGPVGGGPGYDAFGYSTSGTASVSLGVPTGFELGAARAETEDAQLEIASIDAGQTLPAIRVSGLGSVVNRVNLSGYSSTTPGTPAAVQVSARTHFENFGALGGAKALLAIGLGSTIINNADLSRGVLSGDNTGNTGFIHDYGLGTTLINNGDINVTAFSTAGVFIGLSTNPVFVGVQPEVPRATFINNGSINSNYFGLRVNTPFGADIINNGEIDDIVAERSDAGITITNSETGTLGAISINGTSFPSSADGSITVVNDGLIEVASGQAINFRDDSAATRPDAVFDDHVTNSGTIIGDILFNSGDDTFTVVSDGAVTGQVDGGDDTDTLFFADLAGELDPVQFGNFVNFEIIDLSSTTGNQVTANAGDLSAFEQLIIRSGSTQLSTDIAIDTQVGAAGILSGSGTIAGNATVAGALAPTAGTDPLRIGGNLNLADTSTLAVNLTANNASQLIVDGATTLSGGRVLYTVEGRPELDLALGSSIQFNGARTGRFSSLDFFNTPASRTTIGASAGFNGLFDRLNIQQGLVLVESELNGDVFVGAAGALGGNGTITGDLTADGLVSPGASVGALTINGDLSLGSQSTLAIETDATGTDLLTVTGDAQLGGELLFAGAPASSARRRTFQFLDVRGGVTGAFDTITTTSAFSGLTSIVVGPDGLVSLVLTPQIALDPSTSPTSQTAAGYFNDLIISGQATTATDAIFLALNAQAGSPAALDAALSSLQPEIYASSIYAGGRQALAIADVIRPRLGHSRTGESGFAAWLSASDGSSEAGSDAARGLSGYSTDTFVTIGGVEYSDRAFLLGAYAGAINTDQSLDNQAGSASVDGVALGAYGAVDFGFAQSSITIGYVDSDASTRRTIAFLGETANADHDLTVFTTQSDIRRSFDIGSASFTPLLGAVFAHVERSAATEIGGNAALDVDETGEDLLYLDAGGTFARTFDLDNGVSLTPSLWAGWRHELLAPSVSARGGITGTSTNGLYSRAATPDRSRLTLRAALAAQFTEMVSGSISYEGEFADSADASVLSAGLNLRF